jgi:glycerol-1-phosphate dehydrogenase [NAD(P)+]
VQIKKIISKFNIPIKEILIAENICEKAAELLANLGFSKTKKLLITDQNIFPLAQKIINQIDCETLILESPKPDEKNITKIISIAKGFDLIVAVGSGTINDLCKISSFNLNIPYIVFGTAASMNGYASANASIITSSYKTSLPAHLPTAIYLDLNILKNAPDRLTKSGIGDSLCLSTCQFDWLLSHLLLDTYYDSTPFDLLQNHYNQLTTYNLRLTTLAEMLIISGLGMYICGGSYPASQAEHLIAHYLEIKYPQISQNSYHGEQIAVTTLSVAQIQEQILNQENLQITENNFTENDVLETFGNKLGRHFIAEINKKKINHKKAQEINQNLEKNWREIKNHLQKIFISQNQLLQFCKQFDLISKSEEIGFTQLIYNEALNNAHLIRNRFTSLDLIKIIKK